MVCVAICTVVGASIANSAKLTSACDHMVQLVPVLGAGVHPRGPLVNFVWKERACGAKMVIATEF